MFGLFVLAGVVIFAWAWLNADFNSTPPTGTPRNIYEADLPISHQVAVEPGLIPLSPTDLATVPVADEFSYPVGGENAAMAYNAQAFGEFNDKLNGEHLGEDWNGIGGMNSDLADPIYTVARGRVVYVGEPSVEWGKVVVLLHKLPNGDFLQSLYAHLDSTRVIQGQTVARGHVLGTCGTANDSYPAHLHFEMIQSIVNEAGMPGYGKASKDMTSRLDPSSIFAQYPVKVTGMPDPMDAVRRAMIRDAVDRNKINIEMK